MNLHRHLPATLAVVAAVALTATSCGLLQNGSEPVRDESGSITEAADDADVFSLAVGDCTNDADDAAASDEAELYTTVAVVPCDEPHDNEVYASIDLDASEYPGEDETFAQAAALCQDEFDTFVGAPYEESAYDFWPMYPTSESWALGDREVLCLVYGTDLVPVTGTLEGIGS